MQGVHLLYANLIICVFYYVCLKRVIFICAKYSIDKRIGFIVLCLSESQKGKILLSKQTNKQYSNALQCK